MFSKLPISFTIFTLFPVIVGAGFNGIDLSIFTLSLSAISQRFAKPGIDFDFGFDSDILEFPTHTLAKLCLLVKPLPLHGRIDFLALFLALLSPAQLTVRGRFRGMSDVTPADLVGSPLGRF